MVKGSASSSSSLLTEPKALCREAMRFMSSSASSSSCTSCSTDAAAVPPGAAEAESTTDVGSASSGGVAMTSISPAGSSGDCGAGAGGSVAPAAFAVRTSGGALDCAIANLAVTTAPLALAATCPVAAGAASAMGCSCWVLLRICLLTRRLSSATLRSSSCCLGVLTLAFDNIAAFSFSEANRCFKSMTLGRSPPTGITSSKIGGGAACILGGGRVWPFNGSATAASPAAPGILLAFFAGGCFGCD
mmetsp:Transcript_70559/g.132015  ORF Transcript_70559/g.132015 Transcript_70559/m.132015 type:complete len:246 (+) Transcript_70559:51-788(+)